MTSRAGEREVGDVGTLKALADPLRLAMLGALMRPDAGPMTVKEIAAELEEPPTKLYRHIKQLERSGLVVVAGTRLVSGIVESRYAAAQEALRLSRRMFSGGTAEPSDGLGVLLAAVDVLGRDLRRQFGAGRLELAGRPDGPGGAPAFAHLTMRLSPERLGVLRERLVALATELHEEGDSPGADTVEVTLFSLLYGLDPAPGGVSGSR
ncbi:winged helix-turn-helix domain-containing protein [Streptantibioticus silvisoli]|jgi:DNA-binding transcriptional ArsR family regulator|uniref:Helix-turn-helix domain-containing protein n=1 Tax=Streptantibioticus silvisoli TaxID=2705255 RepID=A0ABT6W6Z1_9ACTN|nr:helix-turn-helix domain-containing protein [Streptantibioticus silvisoli]MDI5966509.1 helix-turn-helix domain-containing protein [Streptantibioticus silvisoli]